MPYSSSAGKNWIKERLMVVPGVRRVLDLGIGAGAYSRLFRPLLANAEWIGIEAWAPYISQFDLPSLYDRIVIGDVRYVNFDKLGKFEICFCGDLVEHMSLEEARQLIGEVLDRCQLVFVSIPVGHAPQGPVGGNPFEAHVVDDYSASTFVGVFAGVVDYIVETEGQWTIGAFALTKDADVLGRLQALRSSPLQ